MESRNPTFRGRILVVDSDDWCRQFLSQVLKLVGIEEFRLASSVTEALEAIQSEAFDLLISDLKFPDYQQLLEDCRQRFPGIRFILMLNRRAQPISISYHEHVEVVVKPLSLDEMARKIREAIQRRQRHRVEEQLRRFKQDISRFIG
jgi:DNA-binding NtrC family response regulator